MKVYVAGKVSKESVFKTHHWRDGFCSELSRLSGLTLENLDPTKFQADPVEAWEVFGADCYLISQADAVIVYLTDDISVGGSQEILIAKYFNKPVIGLAPRGGKFNGAQREHFGKIIEDYKDPFVFATCDIVCADIKEVANALKTVPKLQPKTLDIIPATIARYLKTQQKIWPSNDL